MMEPDEEFWKSITIIGGIVFAGAMVSIGLGILGMAVYNKVTKSKITKELYDKKERENGQHRGGSRGSF